MIKTKKSPPSPELERKAINIVLIIWNKMNKKTVYEVKNREIEESRDNIFFPLLLYEYFLNLSAILLAKYSTKKIAKPIKKIKREYTTIPK